MTVGVPLMEGHIRGGCVGLVGSNPAAGENGSRPGAGMQCAETDTHKNGFPSQRGTTDIAPPAKTMNALLVVPTTQSDANSRFVPTPSHELRTRSRECARSRIDLAHPEGADTERDHGPGLDEGLPRLPALWQPNSRDDLLLRAGAMPASRRQREPPTWPRSCCWTSTT